MDVWTDRRAPSVRVDGDRRDDGAAVDETIDAWAERYIATPSLEDKIAPPPVPKCFRQVATGLRVERPGRPPGFVTARASKSPSVGALASPGRRAELVHTFLHHEVQAAELMAWAILAFPESPETFRRGLLGVLDDELRHMRLYREYLLELGFDYGSFRARDWFWERVPRAPSAAHFVALMGVGFEGGNLDHTLRFAKRFRDAGDERGARLQEQVGEEEIPHVRFAWHWFRRWVDPCDFRAWAAHLVPPLSPMLMRGRPIARELRLRAGLSDDFIECLERWPAP